MHRALASHLKPIRKLMTTKLTTTCDLLKKSFFRAQMPHNFYYSLIKLIDFTFIAALAAIISKEQEPLTRAVGVSSALTACAAVVSKNITAANNKIIIKKRGKIPYSFVLSRFFNLAVSDIFRYI